MRKSIRIFSVFLLSLCFFTSCIKDLREIESVESFEYHPSFSVPVGPLSFTLDEIMPTDSILGFEIPDSILSLDTITSPILVYDDYFYFYNPVLGYSTVFTQTMNFSNMTQQSEYIESAMLKTHVHNYIPVSITMQGYLVDGQGNIIDSLERAGPIQLEIPSVSQDGTVIEPAQHTIYTHYDSDTSADLLDVQELQIYLHIQTYDEEIDTLRVYSWYEMEFEFGVRAEFAIPIIP
jgi:hypothetical protein